MDLIDNVIDSAIEAFRFKDTVFYKETSDLHDKYDALKKLTEEFTNSEALLSELFIVKKGLDGENEIAYQLKKAHIEMNKIKKISKQILIGINYCHKKNIIHRDLKPDNILMTKNYDVKICDFGSSKHIERINNNVNKSKSTPYVVTRYYRAPELLLGKSNYDTKIDIFSAGCIIAELFTLSPLFPGLNDGFQIFEYINILGVPNKNYLNEFKLNKETLEVIKQFEKINPYSLEEILNPDNFYNKKDMDEACDLIYNMLKWDYNERYSAEQCLNHPFLKNIDVNENININKNYEFKVINK